MDILYEICAHRKIQVLKERKLTSLATLEQMAHNATAPRGFIKAIEERTQHKQPAIISELKKASPSKGLIRADFDPTILAQSCQQGGATCLSVLTEQNWFQGHNDYVMHAKENCQLPVLRKDFMVDPWQIIQSRAIGADCILLIMAALEDTLAREMVQLAHQWHLDILLEVHDQEELERALQLPVKLIGVNNRNLKTMEVSLDTSRNLIPQIAADGRLTVAESGITTYQEIAELTTFGASAFLIGETIMRYQTPAEGLKNLLKQSNF